MMAETVAEKFEDAQRQVRYRGQFPVARFGIRLAGIRDVKLLGIEMLDARTGYDLSSGYMHSYDDKKVMVEMRLQAWHPAPVWLVFDLAHGPMETEDFVMAKGLRIRHRWGGLELAAIRGGGQFGLSSSSSGSERECQATASTSSFSGQYRQ